MNMKKVAKAAVLATGSVPNPFPRDIQGLAEAGQCEIAPLAGGDVYELRAEPVRKKIGKDTVRMLAYNGSIPGPTLVVPQHAEITIHFTNQTEIDATVHWHGLRLDHRFDGVPHGEHHGMQAPVKPGGSFSYRLKFPDPGLFWYHPHIREDYTQELGLYGNIIVVPADPNTWPPTNREYTLVLDDILIRRGKIAPFSKSTSTRTAMGRFGNVMLVNGETDARLWANKGEVVRLYLTNTANVRNFRLRIPGARMKLIGQDNGRVENEVFEDEMLIAPSERAILDVFFEQPGIFPIEHATPSKTYSLGQFEVRDEGAEVSYADSFDQLRTNPEMAAERDRFEEEFNREPDRVLHLAGEMPGMKHSDMHAMDPIEWEDTMELHNRVTTPENMHWKLVDPSSGKANHDIHWHFHLGDRVKIRIVNLPDSDHPMQHPIHFHGQRFLVLSRDGIRNPNLAWKDTTLVKTGETVDLLLECSNPGAWMVHCHIAEHVEGGMMLTFHVE